MGAKLEIALYQNGLIDIRKVIKYSKEYGLEIIFNKIEYMDNWQYEKYRANDIDNKKVLTDWINLFETKITTIRGIINNSFDCGIYVENECCNKYDVNAWIDVSNYNLLNKNIIDKDNIEIYDLLTKVITKCINNKEWYFCGIGVEILVQNKDDMKMLLNKSSGVCRWILPSKLDISINGYEKKEKYNVFLFDRVM